MLIFLKNFNEKYDFWSFFTDFIFIFGVLIFGWSPVFLVSLFIIDTIVMFLFAGILFHKEYLEFVKTFGFLVISFVMTSFLLGFQDAIISIAEDAGLDHKATIHMYTYAVPLVLVTSGLNHYAAFSESIQKMKDGTYTSSFIKHVFLRYIFMIGMIILIGLSFKFFNTAIVVGLILIKSFLRMFNKKYRTPTTPTSLRLRSG